MLAPLQPIPADAVDLSFPDPQYSNDFREIVGNAASDSDGFDALFNDAALWANTAPDFLAGLDIAIGLAGTSLPDVDKPWEQDFADTVSGSIQQGDPDFQAFGVHMTGNSPPPASGTPPGGGTQKTTSYSAIVTISATVDNFFTQKRVSASCAVGPKTAGEVPQQPAPNSESWNFGTTVYEGPPITLTGEIRNDTNYPFDITGITMDTNTPGQWSFATSGYPSHFAPGDSFRLSITFYPPKS
jgi:hypothetical protein